MKTKINSFGETLVWVQPEGLPGIWTRRDICYRCKPFGECLGFLELSLEEWDKLSALISECNSPEVLKELRGKFSCTNSKSLSSTAKD